MSNHSVRVITLRLTVDDGGYFGYVIEIGDAPAINGMNFDSAIDAYSDAITQLRLNGDRFPLDCPNPFAGEWARDRNMARLIRAGLRGTQ